MEKNWICIYKSLKMQDAEIIKGLLTFNNINSVVISKQDSSYNMFGYFEVYISQDDAEHAAVCLSETPPSEEDIQ